jgi:hypothetical protein
MSNPKFAIDSPDFAAWSNENLARFAKDSYIRMQEQEAALEQLALGLRKCRRQSYRDPMQRRSPSLSSNWLCGAIHRTEAELMGQYR